jgi:Ca2+-binding EF-hand superfamily protein
MKQQWIDSIKPENLLRLLQDNPTLLTQLAAMDKGGLLKILADNPEIAKKALQNLPGNNTHELQNMLEKDPSLLSNLMRQDTELMARLMAQLLSDPNLLKSVMSQNPNLLRLLAAAAEDAGIQLGEKINVRSLSTQTTGNDDQGANPGPFTGMETDAMLEQLLSQLGADKLAEMMAAKTGLNLTTDSGKRGRRTMFKNEASPSGVLGRAKHHRDSVRAGKGSMPIVNPDGSATITVKNADGSMTITVANADGSITTTITNPDGSATTRTINADGSITTVTTNADGTITRTTVNADGSITTTIRNADGTTMTRMVNADGTLAGSNGGQMSIAELMEVAGMTEAEMLERLLAEMEENGTLQEGMMGEVLAKHLALERTCAMLHVDADAGRGLGDTGSDSDGESGRKGKRGKAEGGDNEDDPPSSARDKHHLQSTTKSGGSDLESSATSLGGVLEEGKVKWKGPDPMSVWRKLLGNKMTTKDPPLPLRMVYAIISRIYEAKCEADEVHRQHGEHLPDSLEEYVLMWMLQQYGTKKLVKPKLRVFLKSLQAYNGTDEWVRLFCQFCGVETKRRKKKQGGEDNEAEGGGEKRSSAQGGFFNVHLLTTFLDFLRSILSKPERFGFSQVDDLERKFIQRKLGHPCLAVAVLTLDASLHELKQRMEYFATDHDRTHLLLKGVQDKAVELVYGHEKTKVVAVSFEEVMLSFSGAMVWQYEQELEQLERVFHMFDENHDDGLDFNEFVKCAQGLPSLHLVGVDELQRLFNRYSSDDGINLECFQHAISEKLREMCGGTTNFIQSIVDLVAIRKPPEWLKLTTLETKKFFDKYDSDTNGSLSREEAKDMLKKLYEAISDQELGSVIRIIDSSGDNEICFDEFMVWWQDYGLHCCFSQYDDDGSGELDRSEFRLMLEAMGLPLDDAQLTKTIDEIDDGSGTISYTEFLVWWRNFDQGNAFSVYDKDGSGELELNEIAQLMHDMGLATKRDELQQQVDQIDTDKSGSLNRDEFCALADELHVKLRNDRLHQKLSVVQQVQLEKQQTYLKLSVQKQMLEDKNRIKLVQALQLISVQYSIALTELNKTCSSLFDTSATQKLIVAEDQAASNKQTARRLTQKLGAIDWGEDGPGDGPLLLERGTA